ncbi:MAG: hypothetical protein U0930_26130 [Pirellulales bacterium]
MNQIAPGLLVSDQLVAGTARRHDNGPTFNLATARSQADGGTGHWTKYHCQRSDGSSR